MQHSYGKLVIKNAWKFYAAFMCIFSIWRLLPFQFTFTNAISSCLIAIGVVGLCGYAFNVRIGRVRFWAVYVVLVIFAWVSIMIVLIYLLIVDAELDTVSNTNLMIGLAVDLPLLYALWTYADQTKALWQQGTSETG